VRADVLAAALDAVADECGHLDVPDPFSADADALHAAALRASTETILLACRIERARDRRWRLRRLLGRRPGQRR
jgi:hypothetical protein